MPTTFTWADLLTGVGATSVAALAMVLVQILKGGLPAIFDRVTGATIAFLITGVFYVVGTVVLLPLDANQLLAMFLSWVASALAALGLHGIANNGGRTFVQSQPPDSPPPPQ